MCQEMFFLILATAISGMPTPEIGFSPGQFRLYDLVQGKASHRGSLGCTILSKVHHGESLSVCELNAQPSNWEADTLLLNYRHHNEIFVANA